MKFVEKKDYSTNILIQNDENKTIGIITDMYGSDGDWRIFNSKGKQLSKEVKEKFDAQIPLDVIERKLLELGEDFFLESLKSDNVIVVCTTEFGLEHFIATDHHSGGYPMLVESSKHAETMDLKKAYKFVAEFKENGKIMYVSPKYSGDKIIDVQLANVETVVTLR